MYTCNLSVQMLLIERAIHLDDMFIENRKINIAKQYYYLKILVLA